MSKIRKQYDREFKLIAVELSKTRANMVLLAQELDVRPELLYTTFSPSFMQGYLSKANTLKYCSGSVRKN